MRAFIFFISIFLIQSCFSIETKRLINKSEPGVFYFDSKDTSAFIMCDYLNEPQLNSDDLRKYLNDCLILDQESVDTIPAGKHSVMIRFSFDVNGNVVDVTVLKDPGYGLGKRVVEKILNFKTKLSSDIKCWNFPIAYHRQQITFIIEEECENEISPDIILSLALNAPLPPSL